MRTQSIDEARATFNALKDKIPPMLETNPSLCTATTLQAVCDALRKNPSFSLGHLAVELDLKDLLASPQVARYGYCVKQ